MRATVEHQEKKPSLDPIEVTVVLGKEDLTIKVLSLFEITDHWDLNCRFSYFWVLIYIL